MRIQAERKLEQLETALSETKTKISRSACVDFSIPNTELPKNKLILEIKNLCFSYSTEHLIFNNFNFLLAGPKRVALTGRNGSGKSTLIKLILKKLLPDSGVVNLVATEVAYLDQTVSLLDNSETLIENYLRHHPEAKAFDAYSAFAAFDLRNETAEKKASEFSGGERMRAGLAICLLAPKPAQLIILDEPTNHLDLISVHAIEVAMQVFGGAILAVSHDQTFLNHIGVTAFLEIAS